MKKIQLLFFLLMAAVQAMAQSPTTHIIYAISSGGTNVDVTLESQPVNVNWTVGQAVIDFPTKENDNQTQGFNQAFTCVWSGIDTIWTEVTGINGEIWYENSGTTGPNNHPYVSNWCITAVEDIANLPTAEKVVVYPNPMVDMITIGLPSHLAIGTRLELLDLTGKLLRKTITTEANMQLDLSTLPLGTYLLRASRPDATPISVHRIIKQ